MVISVLLSNHNHIDGTSFSVSLTVNHICNCNYNFGSKSNLIGKRAAADITITSSFTVTNVLSVTYTLTLSSAKSLSSTKIQQM